MQYMHSVFIKYMYTCTKPFPNFKTLSGVNICDVTFKEGGGYVTRSAGGLKS